MGQLTHKVTFTDGTEVEVTWRFTPIAMIHAERELQKPIAPLLAEGYLEPVLFGIWFQLKQQGSTPFKFEQWLEFVGDVQAVGDRSDPGDDSEPDPKPEPGNESS